MLLLCQCSTVSRNPARLDAGHFTASDGKEMPFTRWPAKPTKPAKPRAVVLCVHGLSGAASDFWPAGEAFPQHQVVVYGMQLRGMGNDPDIKARGDLSHPHLWRQDLLEFTRLVRQQNPGIPIYWYGESLGSLIILDTLLSEPKQKSWVDGVILSSPVIAFRHQLPWWKHLGIRTLRLIHPRKRFSLESLGDHEVRVTNKTTHKQQMEKTPHYVEYFTVRLFGSVEKMVRASDKAAGRMELPVLVLYTPNDVFTSAEQVEAFFQRIPVKDKTKVLFPKSYHLLLHDVDRERVLSILEHWVQRQIAN